MEGNNKERELYKLALHSKRIYIGKNQTYNPNEECKARLNAYGQAFEYLKSLQQQQWILLPEIQTEDLKVPISIENKDIPPNAIRIKFVKLNNCKYEKYYLTFSLDAGKNIISKQTEVCDKNCVFNFDCDIPIIQGVDYGSKSIEIRLFEKGFFSSSEIGIGKLPLGGIQTKSLCEGVLNFESKGPSINLSYTLQIREPLERYTTLQIQFIKITKQFPPFNMDEGMKEFLDKFLVQLPTYQEYQQQQLLLQQQQQKEEELLKEQENILQQQQEQEQQQNTQVISQITFLNHMSNNPEIQAIKQFISTNPQLPQTITYDDLLYPENPIKFPVFNFINEYEPLLNKKTAELKTEPSLREWQRFAQKMWEDFLRQKIMISKKLDNQDFEWYINKIENLMSGEEFLLKTYQQLNLTEWVKFIQQRKDILQKELDEISQMNENE